MTGALGEQVRTAERNYNQQQDDVVLHYVELLTSDPAAAVRRLKQSAAGCRWLIYEFLKLKDEWIENGYLVTSRREHATRILGYRPEDMTNQYVYFLWYYNLAARAPRTEPVSVLLADRKRMPDMLRNWFRTEGPPTPEEGQAEVGSIVTASLAALGPLAEQLRTGIEEPARAAAAEKAMLLAPADLALWLRYERMHDAMFHRSYGSLERKESRLPNRTRAQARIRTCNRTPRKPRRRLAKPGRWSKRPPRRVRALTPLGPRVRLARLKRMESAKRSGW